MRPQTLIVLGLALLCGLAAAVGVLTTLRKPPPAAPVVETVPAVVALADIRPGETIDKAMVEVRQEPKDKFPGAFAKAEDAFSRTAHFPIFKGESIVEAKLFPKGSGTGMAALIPPGMRAFTIQTPSFSSSLAGHLLPGYRVDVLLTMVSQGGPENAGLESTSTLLQNIEILAVHTIVEAPTANRTDPNEARSVTLLVTPKQASILDLGQNKGTLHLSLRSLKDDKTTASTSATIADLGLPPAPKPEPVPVVAAPPPEPEPEPEPVPVILPIRTLRGTMVGSDQIIVVTPATKRAAKASPKSPSPASLPPGRLMEVKSSAAPSSVTRQDRPG